ncbi:uncharacterized protein LOC128949492 [Melozone crissalis]|uniref:uncharacterized protein LOC128945505 n=1 Tax=Melozone crissalis TaxID=40204 RepID=UPI0023DC1BFB|nr:uncharacterized protein LOC128945505 [Melozone crissalis]XP_054150322.1 uncharacterized protein LOC128949492 [Melozone crissalis]
MENQKSLKALVAVVATLGEVVAAVTGSHRDVRRRVSPKFLHAALRRFTQSLHETLDHGDVTSMGHSGVPSLVQALAAFEPTPEAWDDVRAVAKAWWELVAALEERWKLLAWEAAELCVVYEQMDPARARDPQDEATHRGTAWDNLVASTVRWSMVALDREEEEEVASVGAMRDAQEAAATSEEEAATNEAMDEAVVATSRARVATRRGHWAEAALKPLKRLVEACDKALAFTRIMEFYLSEIKFILKWGEPASRSVHADLVATVAEFEWLWEASARLFRDHLLGILELINNLLLSPYAGPGVPGGPGGPGSRAVAERCQEAIEDIPRLLWGQ